VRETVERLRQYLTERQYSEMYIHVMCRVGGEIAEYAERKGHSVVERGWLEEFLKLRFGVEYREFSRSTQQTAFRAADMLYNFQQYGDIQRRVRRKPAGIPAYYRCFFDAAEQYADQRQHAQGTRKQFNRQMRNFVAFLESKGIAPREMTNDLIREYFQTLSGFSKGWIAETHHTLRKVLRVAYENGHTVEDFSMVCANIHVPYDAKIPSAYSPEEIEAVLASVDRNNPSEKRDYAILLLGARLGLRSSDIRALRFDNIDWKSGVIRFKQEKTGADIALPLPEDVGWAIIDYVKNARPKTDTPIIFLRHLAPYEPIKPGSGFNNITDKYFHRARIATPNGKHHGMHAFRHSLASHLVAKRVPMPIVSEVLGHTNTKSTSAYIKVDIDGLRKCALEVTGGAAR
jgi:site-specific recombinase XerD